MRKKGLYYDANKIKGLMSPTKFIVTKNKKGVKMEKIKLDFDLYVNGEKVDSEKIYYYFKENTVKRIVNGEYNSSNLFKNGLRLFQGNDANNDTDLVRIDRGQNTNDAEKCDCFSCTIKRLIDGLID